MKVYEGKWSLMKENKGGGRKMKGGSEGEWRMDEEEKDRDGVRGLSY